MVAPATLYRWGRSGRFPLVHRRGLWCLNEKELKRLSGLVRKERNQKNYRKAVRMYFIQTGRTPAAAKKFLQRRRAAGRTLYEALEELVAQSEAMAVKLSRG